METAKNMTILIYKCDNCEKEFIVKERPMIQLKDGTQLCLVCYGNWYEDSIKLDPEFLKKILKGDKR